VLRVLGWTGAGLALTVVAAAAAGWWWAGTPQSLPATLAFAARHLPAGQTLEVREATGSLRAGGQLAWLRWQSPALRVEVTGLQLRWQLRPLLDRRLQVDQFQAAQVVLTPGPPTESPEGEPLQSVTLPIDIELPFDVREIVWAAASPLTVRGLAGHYRYADSEHQLRLDGVEVADGRYAGTLNLQGPAPMAITAALRGTVTAPMAQGVAPLVVQAQADVQGTLAQPDGRLKVAARVAPQDGGADGMRATLDAEIAPWQAQPVVTASGEFVRIDAARFWPGLPHTDLSGTVAAGPVPPAQPGAPTAWQARLQARNALPGPWDRQRLPVAGIDATARLDGQDWTIPASTIEAGGGEIQLQGRYSPAPAPWQVEATVRDVRPAQLFSTLDASPVGGTLVASQQADTIAFDAALQAAAAPRGKANGAAGADALRVDVLRAQGQWHQPTQALDVKTLRIDAGPARIAGELQAQIASQSGSGKLDLTLPGATARVNGRLAPQQGQAQAQVDLRDAAALQRWVASLPGLADVFAGARMAGAAKLDLRYDGGWASLQQQIANPGTPVRGLAVQMALDAPRLDLQLPSAAPATASAAAPTATAARAAPTATRPRVPPSAAGARAAPTAAGARAGSTAPSGNLPTAPAGAEPMRVQLRDLKARLAGTPADATLDVDGTATVDAQRLTLSTRASGGISGPNQWRLALASLRASVASVATGTAASAASAAPAAPWVLQLQAPLTATVRKIDGPGWRVESSGSSATLQGPAPGRVQLQWEPLLLVQTAGATAQAPSRVQLRSRGRLIGLPMAWAEAFSTPGQPSPLQTAGISGDLVFDGDWDIEALDTLRATARLARRSGDLQVRAGDAALVRRIHTEGTGTASETRYDGARAADAPATPAGIRRAELTISAEGLAVRAQLNWDSERAGDIQADVRSRVVQQDGGYSWAEDAPLSGVIAARLPDIGVWSMFAPPAWRIDGSLAANATLAGTRAVPQWNGTLSGDGLAVRAAVEGIELQDGRLRASLAGNRLTLQEFSLKGGSASRARIAGPSGNLSTVSSEAARDGGELRVTGDLSWGEASAERSAIRMAMQAQLRRLRVLVRSDRQVSVSGDLQAKLEAGQLTVGGAVTADRGVIILPDETAPTLGTDVTIRSAAIDAEARARQARAQASLDAAAAKSAKAVPAKTPDIAVSIDMGNDFAVQGHGLVTRLGGQLQVVSNSQTRGEPRVTGQIRTVQGRYRAYGQQLDVESGLASFNGPIANPSLDILAVRPNLEQKAGVRITGTAQSPRVALYSNPTLTDAETLSWMLLGRSTAGGGAEAAVMQQAALALLGGFGPKGGGGNFATRFGLDEIGFKGPASGEDATSSAITLGKRLTDQIYVTYEASLAGSLGTLYIFYDLTRNLALRGQAGLKSGVDLIYTLSYD
jgi:translocation and assembly module TamB